MNTPIGKANELPIRFKEDSNEKALIKYENHDDYMCFLALLIIPPNKTRRPKKY